MKKLCVVIQRYGPEINGGAEDYCRKWCEKLRDKFHVEVLTTCARDYTDWGNFYPVGTTDINGVKVRRFGVERPRSANFDALCAAIFFNPDHTIEQSERWIEAQGPYSPSLCRYIEDNVNSFDLFIFMTYLYYPSVIGARFSGVKTVLIPFAHDEPMIYLKSFHNLFTNVRGIVYNTPEEKNFVNHLFNNGGIPSVLTGIGIETPKLTQNLDFTPIDKPYMLYMGRIDSSKGCDELFHYFDLFKKKTYSSGCFRDLTLVLTGKEVMNVPPRDDIISLGFVSEEVKAQVLNGCEVLVLPSKFESLSIVVLEAMAAKKPVLVNGGCDVLQGHCRRSNAGLWYSDFEDFSECVELLFSNAKLRRAMGENGVKYVNQNYRWNVLMPKMTAFINKMCT